jgi:hypothetical protein
MRLYWANKISVHNSINSTLRSPGGALKPVDLLPQGGQTPTLYQKLIGIPSLFLPSHLLTNEIDDAQPDDGSVYQFSFSSSS